MDNKEGVWRTIRGRRVFIAKGESLGQAMAKSGKFKREDIREGKHELKFDSKQDKLDRADNKRYYKTKQSPEEKQRQYLNARQKHYAEAHKFNEAREDKNQAEKNRINEQAPVFEKGKTRLERNALRYSNTDRQEIKHEQLQKKLAEYKAKKQSNNKIENNDEFDMRKYTIELQHDKGTKKIDTVASNKESAIKNVLKSENAPNNAVKSVKDNGSILNKQSNNKIVSDWENGAISDEEALKRFNGDKELATKTFENMGYKSPFKQSNNKQKTQWENFEINDNIRGIYNKENGDVVYTTGKGANIQSYKSSIDKLKKEDFPHTHEGLVRNYLENKQSNNKQETIKNYVEKKKSNRLTKEDKNYNDTKKDILEGFTEDYGYGDTTPEKAFIKQIDSLKTNSKGQQYKSIYEAGKEYAQGASGTMLVYNGDMVDYLKTKGIKANINNAFDKYTDYMAKNIEKMYNEFKKKGK